MSAFWTILVITAVVTLFVVLLELVIGGLLELPTKLLLSKWLPRRAAKTITRDNEAWKTAELEIERVRALDYDWLDQDFYDQAERELTRSGYRTLADCENVTTTKQVPYLRTFNRAMISQDGAIVGTFFQHKPLKNKVPLKWRWLLKTYNFYGMGFGTEFMDGSFLLTDNTKGETSEIEIPGIARQTFPPETPVCELEARHREALDYLLQTAPSLAVRPCRNWDDFVAGERRSHTLLVEANFSDQIAHAVLTEEAGKDRDMRDLLRAYEKLRSRERIVAGESRPSHSPGM